ncbi:exocyst complex component EXO70H1-like [Malania oleifera]|uniref:exocyst complex component EXO70H1-like n=1 Tax=Malania oleifera TaxID=397392 RepID=UPI0025AE6514|nr:exocyst complex component EXO70H1-like [Malania oleifera]
MPRKGMRSLFFSAKSSPTTAAAALGTASWSLSSFPSTPRRAFSVIDQIIEAAQAMVTKWNPDTSTYMKVTSLFHENRREAKEFLKCVTDLQKAMHLVASDNTSSDRLVRAQGLMQVAMKRLQKEFYQILSMNRAHLDPESVSARSSRVSTQSSTSDCDEDVGTEDEIRAAGDSISEVEQVSANAMADLRSIAECMMAAGYGKECVHIYKTIRKSIVDEGIYRLGVEKLTSSQVHKMDWEVLELRLKSWLDAMKIAVKTLFTGERILCDHIFAASDYIRESCFTEISKEGAMTLFRFPEIVTKSKKSPERVFRMLDLYAAIAEHWTEIESIFSFESTSAIQSQALKSLQRLGEAVRTMLSDFESAINKDSSKTLVANGGVHPLTVNAMNYLSLLADYSSVITDIVADWSPPAKSQLPNTYSESSDSDDAPAPVISLRLAWLVLALLCKLDGKAKHYKDVSLSYLFLANNLQHVVFVVRTSNLRYLLSDKWTAKQEARIQQFTTNYERSGWSQVFSSLPEEATAALSPDRAKACFKKFNCEFEHAYRKQSLCVVPDSKLRDEIKDSIARKIVPAYRAFYDTHRITLGTKRDLECVVRYTPDELENYLSDLFFGMDDPACASSPSSSPSHGRNSWSR